MLGFVIFVAITGIVGSLIYLLRKSSPDGRAPDSSMTSGKGMARDSVGNLSATSQKKPYEKDFASPAPPYFKFVRVILLVALVIFLIRMASSPPGRNRLISQPFVPQEPLIFKEGNVVWKLTPTGSLDEELFFFQEDRAMAYKGFTPTAFFAMSPSTYRKFFDKQQQKVCPAGLLNSELQLYLIVTDKPDVLKTISSLRQGMNIRLKGYRLDISHSFVNPGRVNFVMSPPTKNAHLVYVQAIEELP